MKPRWPNTVPDSILEHNRVPISTVRIGKHSYVLTWGDVMHGGRWVSMRGAKSTLGAVVRPGQRWVDVFMKST